MPTFMEFIVVLLLFILNGLFAMAEIAIVSIRKAKLQKQAQEGNVRAQAALELSNNPNRFLSTVQIGITFIGIFTGAFAGEPLARSFAGVLQQIPLLSLYSKQLAFFLVVLFITYLSLIIGELVPKRIALTNPEKIGKLVARPMKLLSNITSPLVTFLTVSSDVVMRLLRIKPSQEPKVSEEEVRMLLQEGTMSGVFNREEKDIVERTFQLNDKKIISFMTPRKEIVWLDIDSPFKKLRSTIVKHPHSHFPVCRKSLDNVVGVIQTEEILTSLLTEETIMLDKSLHKPNFIPETMDALKLLEVFKKTGIHMALVVDEYGSVLGLLSLADILEEIVGDIPTINELEEKEIMKRNDGTYVVAGLLAIDEFKKYFRILRLPDEEEGAFHTVGGFVMDQLGRIPSVGDRFRFGELRFKVVAMDGNRVNKVLVAPQKKLS